MVWFSSTSGFSEKSSAVSCAYFFCDHPLKYFICLGDGGNPIVNNLPESGNYVRGFSRPLYSKEELPDYPSWGMPMSFVLIERRISFDELRTKGMKQNEREK